MLKGASETPLEGAENLASNAGRYLMSVPRKVTVTNCLGEIMEKNREQATGLSINDAFEQSGIPFQQKCSSFIKSSIKGWRINLEEFPISVGTMDTRVDFIAEAKGGIFKIIAECKLSDQRYKTWFFPKTTKEHFPSPNWTYVVRKDSHTPSVPLYNRAQIRRENKIYYAGISEFQSSQCLEIKRTEKKEKAFALEPIQNASHQLSLSCFGLMAERCRYFSENDTTGFEYFLPVIFTRAKLRYAEYDPSNEQLILNDKEVPWVIYHHGVSDQIWKEMRDKFNGEDPNKRLSIAIVNEKNIKDFFVSLNEYMEI